MEETGYETFAFYYDSLTQNVNYDERAEYFDRLIQTFLHSEMFCWIWHAEPEPCQRK